MATAEEVFKGTVDFVESFDNAQPYPTYHTLQDEWHKSLEAEFPWDEIEVAALTATEVALDGVTALFSLFMDASKSKGWSEKTPEERLAHIHDITSRPNVPQRSAEWYQQSKNVLTASEFSAILGTPRSVGQCALKKVVQSLDELVLAPSSKLACSTLEMSAMDWGVRFEPVVKQILTGIWGAEILDVGRLLHPTDPQLAASPDGLIVAAADSDRVGRLVEIKCPVRREMNGKIPFEYWCQMQIQMEVTGIDECEYIEVKLVSPYKESLATYVPAKEGHGSLYFGKVWLIQEPNTLELKYAYTSLECKDFENLGWNVIEVIPWHLDSFYTKTVTRDRLWYASTEEKRVEFWKKVEEARAGTFILAPSARAPKLPQVTVCKIMDNI